MKKLFCFGLSILVALSVIAMPVGAEGADSLTLNVPSAETVVAEGFGTLSLDQDISLPNKRDLTSGLGPNDYAIFNVEMVQAADCSLTLGVIPYNDVDVVQVELDGVYIGKYDLKGAMVSSEYSLTVGLSKGEHTIKLICKGAAGCWPTSLTIKKEGAFGGSPFSFKFNTVSNTELAQDGTNDAVAAGSFGPYSDLAVNGWARFKMPEGYLSGDYEISIYGAASEANVSIYLGSENTTSIDDSGKVVGTSAAGGTVATGGVSYLDNTSLDKVTLDSEKDLYLTIQSDNTIILKNIIMIPSKSSEPAGDETTVYKNEVDEANKLTTLEGLTDDTLVIRSTKDSGVMIAALYQNGNLLKAAFGNENKQATISNVTTQADVRYELRVYYWESLDSLSPVDGYWEFN